MGRIHPYLIISSSLLIGAGSGLLFLGMLFFGPPRVIRMGLSSEQALLLDAALSCIFFMQHSVMIRRSVRRRLSKLVPDYSYGAFYSITSGIPLAALVLFWQEIPQTIASADGAAYWLLYVPAILALAGFYWGVRSLGGFDMLGIRQVRRHMKNIIPKQVPITVRGPYRWVRHPLYFFMLLMIWFNPVLTPDRLLFDVLWTVWIMFGSMLEERDLEEDFGGSYRAYRSKVPMLIPWKIPRGTY